MLQRLSVGMSVVLLAALGSLTQNLRGEQVADERVRAALSLAEVWLEAQRDYEQMPGISAGVIYDQQMLWKHSYGYADLKTRRPTAADTIYSICSISKLFTSVAVMQLRDAGKVRLDDPVAKHLSWFAIKRTMPDSTEITVEGLLTHASGLPREAAYPYWIDGRFPTHDEIVAGLAKQEPLHPAERYFEYSNLGLTLVGEIVAAQSGLPYADYVRRNILQPLGLLYTSPEMPESEKDKRLATGYSAINRLGTRQPTPFFQTRGLAPAAGYASTVEDLGRFASWQFRLLEHGRSEVLNANTLREMHRVHFIDFSDSDSQTLWGLGFKVWRSDGKTFVGHGGWCPGFQTQLLLRSEDKIAIVFMVNADNPTFMADRYAQRLYDIVAPAIRASSETSEKPKQFDASLDSYVGLYEAFAGETAVVRWEDGLALLGLPTADPVKSLLKLKKIGEHRFRRIRLAEGLGEEVVFELGPDGKATRLLWDSNYFPRVKTPQ